MYKKVFFLALLSSSFFWAFSSTAQTLSVYGQPTDDETTENSTGESTNRSNSANYNTLEANPDTENSVTTTSETAPEKTCSEVLIELNSKVTHYADNNLKHLDIYQKLLTSLTTLAYRAELYGYDNTTLLSDIVKMEQLVMKYSTSFNTFAQRLTQSSNYVCPESPGYYDRIYLPITEALEVTQKSTMDIRVFFEEQIVEDILSMEMIEEDEE